MNERKLEVIKIDRSQEDLGSIYKIGGEELIIHPRGVLFKYVDKKNVPHTGWVKDIPIPKSKLLETLESGEISEEEFEKIRKIHMYPWW